VLNFFTRVEQLFDALFHGSQARLGHDGMCNEAGEWLSYQLPIQTLSAHPPSGHSNSVAQVSWNCSRMLVSQIDVPHQLFTSHDVSAVIAQTDVLVRTQLFRDAFFNRTQSGPPEDGARL
jgi:hypothetical protein